MKKLLFEYCFISFIFFLLQMSCIWDSSIEMTNPETVAETETEGEEDDSPLVHQLIFKETLYNQPD